MTAAKSAMQRRVDALEDKGRFASLGDLLNSLEGERLALPPSPDMIAALEGLPNG